MRMIRFGVKRRDFLYCGMRLSRFTVRASMIQRLIGLPVLGLMVLLCGCASPWEKNYQPNPLVGRSYPPTSRVDLRVVEFERLANYERAEHERRVHSTTAPEDYTQQERLAAKNRLLEALQLPDRGDSIVILGWSRFAESDQLDLRSRQLADFAKKIGANVVVSSGAYGGAITGNVLFYFEF